MFEPIAGDGNAQRFALRLCPDGVYRVDGRAIPSSGHPAVRVDDKQSVSRVHRPKHVIGRLGGAVLGVDVKQ